MNINEQPAFDWNSIKEVSDQKKVETNLNKRVLDIVDEIQTEVKEKKANSNPLVFLIYNKILRPLGIGEFGKKIKELETEKKQIDKLLLAPRAQAGESEISAIPIIDRLIHSVRDDINKLKSDQPSRTFTLFKSKNQTPELLKKEVQLKGFELIKSVTQKVLEKTRTQTTTSPEKRPPPPSFSPKVPEGTRMRFGSVVDELKSRQSGGIESVRSAIKELREKYVVSKTEAEEGWSEDSKLSMKDITGLETELKQLIGNPSDEKLKALEQKTQKIKADFESKGTAGTDSGSSLDDVDESMADSIYDDSEEEWVIPEWGIISTKQSSSENQMGKVDVLLNDAAAKLREVANDKTKNIKIETANGKLSLVVTSRPIELPVSIDVKDRSANAFIYLLAIVEKASKNPETVQQSKEMLNDLRSSNWGTTVLAKPKYQDLQKKLMQLDAQIESYTEEVAGDQLALLKESVSHLRGDTKLRVVNNELTATEREGTKGLSKQSQLAMWTALVRLEAAVAKIGFTSDALDVMAILKSSPWGKAVLSIPHLKAKFDSIESQVNTIDDPKVLAYRFCTLRDLVKENEKPENADKALVFKNGVFALEENAPLALREDAVRQSSLLLRVLCDKLTDESMIGEIKRVYKDGLFPDSKLPATFAEASIINLKDGIAKLSKDILSGNNDLRVDLVGHFIERVYSDSFQAASDISLLFKRQETNLRKMFDHFQDEEKIKDDEGVVFKWDDIANGPNIISDCIKSYADWKGSGFDDTQKDAKIDTGVKTPIFKFKSFISEVCKRAEKEITGPEAVEAKKRLTDLKDMMRKNAGANAQPLDLVELEAHIDWFARQIK